MLRLRMPAPQVSDQVFAWHATLTGLARDAPGPMGHAVAAVLEEHRVLRLVSHPAPVCRACWYAADRARPVEHPCPTVIKISRALAVPVPDAGKGAR
jgi:hypothetical protein